MIHWGMTTLKLLLACVCFFKSKIEKILRFTDTEYAELHGDFGQPVCQSYMSHLIGEKSCRKNRKTIVPGGS